MSWEEDSVTFVADLDVGGLDEQNGADLSSAPMNRSAMESTTMRRNSTEWCISTSSMNSAAGLLLSDNGIRKHDGTTIASNGVRYQILHWLLMVLAIFVLAHAQPQYSQMERCGYC
jgi:hypothetical protein